MLTSGAIRFDVGHDSTQYVSMNGLAMRHWRRYTMCNLTTIETSMENGVSRYEVHNVDDSAAARNMHQGEATRCLCD